MLPFSSALLLGGVTHEDPDNDENDLLEMLVVINSALEHLAKSRSDGRDPQECDNSLLVSALESLSPQNDECCFSQGERPLIDFGDDDCRSPSPYRDKANFSNSPTPETRLHVSHVLESMRFSPRNGAAETDVASPVFQPGAWGRIPALPYVHNILGSTFIRPLADDSLDRDPRSELSLPAEQVRWGHVIVHPHNDSSLDTVTPPEIQEEIHGGYEEISHSGKPESSGDMMCLLRKDDSSVSCTYYSTDQDEISTTNNCCSNKVCFNGSTPDNHVSNPSSNLTLKDKFESGQEEENLSQLSSLRHQDLHRENSSEEQFHLPQIPFHGELTNCVSLLSPSGSDIKIPHDQQDDHVTDEISDLNEGIKSDVTISVETDSSTSSHFTMNPMVSSALIDPFQDLVERAIADCAESQRKSSPTSGEQYVTTKDLSSDWKAHIQPLQEKEIQLEDLEDPSMIMERFWVDASVRTTNIMVNNKTSRTGVPLRENEGTVQNEVSESLSCMPSGLVFPNKEDAVGQAVDGCKVTNSCTDEETTLEKRDAWASVQMCCTDVDIRSQTKDALIPDGHTSTCVSIETTPHQQRPSSEVGCQVVSTPYRCRYCPKCASREHNNNRSSESIKPSRVKKPATTNEKASTLEPPAQQSSSLERRKQYVAVLCARKSNQQAAHGPPRGPQKVHDDLSLLQRLTKVLLAKDVPFRKDDAGDDPSKRDLECVINELLDALPSEGNNNRSRSKRKVRSSWKSKDASFFVRPKPEWDSTPHTSPQRYELRPDRSWLRDRPNRCRNSRTSRSQSAPITKERLSHQMDPSCQQALLKRQRTGSDRNNISLIRLSAGVQRPKRKAHVLPARWLSHPKWHHMIAGTRSSEEKRLALGESSEGCTQQPAQSSQESQGTDGLHQDMKADQTSSCAKVAAAGEGKQEGASEAQDRSGNTLVCIHVVGGDADRLTAVTAAALSSALTATNTRASLGEEPGHPSQRSCGCQCQEQEDELARPVRYNV